MKFRTKYLYRSAGMGDVLWTEPIVKALAGKNKKIVLFTHFTDLFKHYSLPNVQVRKIPSGWYRMLLKGLNIFSQNQTYHKLDGVYEAMPKMHMLHAYQHYFSLPLKNEYPTLYLSEAEKMPIQGLPHNYAVLHLDAKATLNYRKIYGVNWNEIVDYLQSQKIEVILTGENIEPLKNATIFQGSIRDLIQLIYHAVFFIGVDSGPSHIAASLKKPSLLFFGSVNPWFRHFPEQLQGFILQQPCEYAGCYHDAIVGEKQLCKLVGNSGIPKCCLHTTESVKMHIDLLFEKYIKPK